MHTIVVLDGYTENPGDLSWEGLAALGELTVYDRTGPEDVVSRIAGADIVYINKVSLTAEIFAACPSLRFVGILATGYDNIDIQVARSRDITVCNVPAYGTNAVGQFAIALLLEICHHIGHHHNAVLEGKWERCLDVCFWDYPLIELADKTMGVIGFGKIGQTTAKIAKSLGMHILAYDTRQYPALEDEYCRYASLDEIFTASDVISLHCPLFPETREIINRTSIAKMKDGVIILNNSRGALIAEQDLADALNSGKVYAAAVDVVSTEPIRGDNPLLTAKNCIITPHISWASKESRQRLMDIAVNNLRQFLAGKPVNVVN